MNRKTWMLAGILTAAAVVMAGSLQASSHREAPLTSQDPLADNTDVYAFVHPAHPDRVTLIANFIPFEEGYGGPNFFKFDDNVLYEIMVDNDGDAVEDVTYQFRFRTSIGNPNTFLYNTGTITSLDSATFNVKQFYDVIRIEGPRRRAFGRQTTLGSGLPTPPVNVGERSTPNYETLGDAGIQTLSDGSKVFAGQRDDPFFVDLGSVFDLLGLRPFNAAHLIPQPGAPGVDGLVFPGVASEFDTLSTEERTVLVDAVAARNAGRVPLVVGVSAPDAASAARYAAQARDVGASAVMAMAPPAMREHADALADYYRRIAAERVPITMRASPFFTRVHSSNRSPFCNDE